MTRDARHWLADEGAAYIKVGQYSWRISYKGTGGIGRAKCSCGALSEDLPSGNQRKKWHREHRAEAKALQGAAA